MNGEECPIEGALRLLGRRGSLLVVRDLVSGCRRFRDLQGSTHLPPHTLSRRLKELQEAGVIERVPYQEIPPKVEYYLTPAGTALGPLLDELRKWGEGWLPRDRT